MAISAKAISLSKRARSTLRILPFRDRLEFPIAALLGRAAGGIPLDQIKLAQRRIFFLTIGQLARQAHAVQHALAPRNFTRLAGSFARASGFDDFSGDDTRIVRSFEEKGHQLFGHDLFDHRSYFRRYEFVFGLRRKLRLRCLYREHAGQALAHIVAGCLDFGFLRDVVLFDVATEGPRHRGAQTGQVGAAVALRNVVGKAQHRLLIRVVPLHGHINRYPVALARGLEDIRMQHGFVAVDEFDESAHAAAIGENFLVAGTLINKTNVHAIVQER